MTRLTEILKKSLKNDVDRIFVKQLGSNNETSIKDINDKVYKLSMLLKTNQIEIEDRIVGLAMSSSLEWIVADIFLLMNRGIGLPVPLDFTDQQIESLLGKVDVCFVQNKNVGRRLSKILPGLMTILPCGEVYNHGVDNKNKGGRNLLLENNGVIKIIHTSGTTSNPKGVLIKNASVGILIQNLLATFDEKRPLHYLSLVPMSLLIEQVLGIYIPLISGGSITLTPDGLEEFGSQVGNADKYLSVIKASKCNFIYLPPALLEQLDKYEEPKMKAFGGEAPYIITGGAKISMHVLDSLHKKGVDVFEAYGLSENSSVISINTKKNKKIGTAGKFLPGIQYRVTDGELQIKSPTLCCGYFNTDETSCELTDDGYLKTGDLVEIDNDGFLHIVGRKKHVIILSNARNVSPEWVESLFKDILQVEDIIVIGDGKESLRAIILANANIENKRINKALEQTNKKLPTFAVINGFLRVKEKDIFREKYFTVTNRPKRKEIADDFENASFEYLEEEFYV